MANKKTNNNKKISKKEEVKVEKVKKKENKVEEKKLLSDKKIAILYVICALCWVASAILEYVGNKKISYLDICISVILIILAVVYFRKSKINK